MSFFRLRAPLSSYARVRMLLEKPDPHRYVTGRLEGADKIVTLTDTA
jgi:hypothetical protein